MNTCKNRKFVCKMQLKHCLLSLALSHVDLQVFRQQPKHCSLSLTFDILFFLSDFVFHNKLNVREISNFCLLSFIVLDNCIHCTFNCLSLHLSNICISKHSSLSKDYNRRERNHESQHVILNFLSLSLPLPLFAAKNGRQERHNRTMQLCNDKFRRYR